MVISGTGLSTPARPALPACPARVVSSGLLPIAVPSDSAALLCHAPFSFGSWGNWRHTGPKTSLIVVAPSPAAEGGGTHSVSIAVVVTVLIPTWPAFALFSLPPQAVWDRTTRTTRAPAAASRWVFDTESLLFRSHARMPGG